uniref:Uncharacterized protein n=1 Tax=Pinguiococcus pyrenoidosus TaxID=172671 RepID=A0A7R9YCZ4_9STRA
MVDPIAVIELLITAAQKVEEIVVAKEKLPLEKSMLRLSSKLLEHDLQELQKVLPHFQKARDEGQEASDEGQEAREGVEEEEKPDMGSPDENDAWIEEICGEFQELVKANLEQARQLLEKDSSGIFFSFTRPQLLKDIKEVAVELEKLRDWAIELREERKGHLHEEQKCHAEEKAVQTRIEAEIWEYLRQSPGAREHLARTLQTETRKQYGRSFLSRDFQRFARRTRAALKRAERRSRRFIQRSSRDLYQMIMRRNARIEERLTEERMSEAAGVAPILINEQEKEREDDAEEEAKTVQEPESPETPREAAAAEEDRLGPAMFENRFAPAYVWIAAYRNDVDWLLIHLNEGIELDARCPDIPAHEYFRVREADPEMLELVGATAFLTACILGHDKVVAILLDNEQTDDKLLQQSLRRGDQSLTGLDLARQKGHSAVVEEIQGRLRAETGM